jgi:hypothetical protein
MADKHVNDLLPQGEIKTQMTDMKVNVDPEKFEHKDYKEYERSASRLGIVSLGKPKGFYGNHLDPNLTLGQLANSFMLQMFDASDLAPGQMRDKVLAYQQEVMTILVHHLREAMRSERLRIGLELEAAGHSSAAALVKSLNL